MKISNPSPIARAFSHAVTLLFILGLSVSPSPGQQHKTLIVIFDGMRADYITPGLMPELWAFRESASRAERHHSVFPTVTRVNSASFATGSYPANHGLLGNAVYFPKVNPGKATGTSHGDLVRIAASESGKLLTGTSIGEVLDKHGERMMVFSSGTSGQAFLQNHTVGKGAIVNPGLILPESFRAKVVADLGAPETNATGLNKHKWITDALIRYSLTAGGPLVSTIWFSDPDGAGHKGGIGSDELKEALAFVDAQFGRIIRHLEAGGLRNQYNIIATTDHGFVTYTGKQGLTDLLIGAGLKKDKDSDDVVLAEGAVYVKNRDQATIKKIIEVLHKTPWVGAVFTKGVQPGSMQGWVPGTFSFESVHYHHTERTGDILAAVNWNDNPNEWGYAGSDFSVGTAGHGGSSPYEIGIRLFAQGPDFKKGYVSELPSSIIDIVPTVLSFYGYSIPADMNGRVLYELLQKGKSEDTVPNHDVLTTEADYPWGTYKLRLDISFLGRSRYFNFSATERIVK